MVETRIREIGNIDETLRSLEPKLQAKVMRRAMRLGGNVVRDEARRRAPVQDGILRRNIKTVVGKSRSTGAWTASVGIFPPSQAKDGRKAKPYAYYARWVELGHLIVPRRRSRNEGFTRVSMTRSADGSLRPTRVRTTRQRVREQAATSGRRVAPRPFLEPSLEAKQHDAVEALMDELDRGLVEILGEAL